MTTATNILLYSKMYPAFVDYTRVDHVLNELTPYMLHSSYLNPPRTSDQNPPRTSDQNPPRTSDQNPPEMVYSPPPSISVEPIVTIKIQSSPQPAPSIRAELPEPVRDSAKNRTQPSAQPPFFRPTQEDTLFSCVYVAKYAMQIGRATV